MARKKNLGVSIVSLIVGLLFIGVWYYAFWAYSFDLWHNFVQAYTAFSKIGTYSNSVIGIAVLAVCAFALLFGIAGFIVALAHAKKGHKTMGIISSVQLAVFGTWAGLATFNKTETLNKMIADFSNGHDKLVLFEVILFLASYAIYIILSVVSICTSSFAKNRKEAVAPAAAEETKAVTEEPKETAVAESPVKEEEKKEAEPVEKEPEEKPVEEKPEEKAEEPKAEEKPAEQKEEPVEETEKKEPVVAEEKAEEAKPAEEPKTEEVTEEKPVEKAPVAEPEKEVTEEVKPAETPVEEKEEEKPAEPVEEAKAAEPAPIVVAPTAAPKTDDEFVRISFEDRLAKSDPLLKDEYKEIRDYALSYGIKSRVTFSGDTFRLHTVKYLKIIVAGKKLKLYYKLDPKKYEGTTIPYDDVSDKKLYADTPFAFKVRSALSVKRAKALIDDMMKEAGFTRKEPVEEEKVQPVEDKPVAADAKDTTGATSGDASAPSDDRYSGKYEIYPEAGFYKFRLKASNGEILLVSNGYISKDGAKNGINTLKKNLPNGKKTIITDKNGFSHFRINTANDARLVIAGEYYKTKDAAQSALTSVERFANTDRIDILDSIPDSDVREFIVTLPEPEKKPNGKIEYFLDEETRKWKARLLASNGEVLFVTAGYASKQGVASGVEAIRKQLDEDTIHICRDKQNRYQFKVATTNGQILVMGETYGTKDAAASAANSARAFLPGATVVDTTKAVAEEPADDTAAK